MHEMPLAVVRATSGARYGDAGLIAAMEGALAAFSSGMKRAAGPDRPQRRRSRVFGGARIHVRDTHIGASASRFFTTNEAKGLPAH